VLLLHKDHNAQDIHTAINKAVRTNVSCSDAVLQILNSSKKPDNIFTSLPNWDILPTPDVTVYSQIGGVL